VPALAGNYLITKSVANFSTVFQFLFAAAKVLLINQITPYICINILPSFSEIIMKQTPISFSLSLYP